MIINALNSGANVFMADFEDANSPTFENCVQGQLNLCDAVRRTIEIAGPSTFYVIKVFSQTPINPDRLPAWIRALIWISGRKLQRESIQLVLDAGYTDGFRTLHPDDKGYTFPTWDPHVRLDYVFVPCAFKQRLAESVVITEPTDRIKAASDHCPLVAVLAAD